MPTGSPRCGGWGIALKRNELSLKGTHEPHRPGIRNRIMLYLVLFVAFVIALLWLFQIVWLDDFYRYSKTRQIRIAAETVAGNLEDENIALLMDMLSAQNDVCILVLDESHKTVLSSEDTRFCLIHRLSARDLSWWCDKVPEDGSTLVELFNIQPFQQPTRDWRFKGLRPPYTGDHYQSLLCARRVTLPGGQQGYLLLNSMITPIDATVATLRSQLVLITAAALLVALLLAALISRNVSRPIIETNRAARSLSHGQYTAPDHGDTYREIAELNTTLRRAADDLGQVERLQHELIANISHDLRTPLTMIGGYAEAMRDIPGENTPENMQIIMDETARLSSLVEEVLDFSRLQAGTLPMNRAAFPLTSSVSAMVERIGKLVAKDGYSVHFDPDTQLSAVADEARIGQVVYNLIGNALTYTGGDRQVYVTQEVRESRVRITVTDTGRGIPADELPLIWNRYYRARESHRRAIIGSGLGLSIVQGILMQHGAPYGVDSQEGHGSSFWFELPLAESSENHRNRDG